MIRALSLLALTLLMACATEPTPASPAPESPEAAPAPAPEGAPHTGTIKETMDAAGYTYALIDTPAGEVWLAGPQTPGLRVGQPLSAPQGLLMVDFTSPTLQRSFERIYFVSSLDSAPAAAPAEPSAAPGAPRLGLSVQAPMDVAEGGRSVSQIVRHAPELAGQEVTVRGRVVKYNPNIMGTNWLHIQDGSGSVDQGDHDLTVTSADTAAEGDVVLVHGEVSVDRDFGMGYRYPVILEGASVQVEAPE